MNDTSVSEQHISEGKSSGLVRFAVGVIVLNLGLLGFFLWNRSASAVDPPRYGERLSSWTSFRDGGKPFRSADFLDGHWAIVLYSHRKPPEPLVRYLSVLLGRYESHQEGLRVVLLQGQEHEGEVGRNSVAGVNYPTIADQQGSVRRRLGLPPHADWTFLVAPGGELVLSAAGLVSRDELRQHVEKHLQGAIQYSWSAVTHAGPDERLPAYSVVSVAAETGSRTVEPYRPAAGTTVLVLPAELCATCNPEAVYDRIAALSRTLCTSPDSACPVQLLLTAGYPPADALWQLDQRGVMGVRVFQATETLRGLEDEYFTKRKDSADALVLTIGAEQRVLSVSPLRHLLESSSAAS